jgi:chaperonin cofactor prefoldin
MGPILVKQSLADSKMNINKRIDFINTELGRCNDRIGVIEKDQDKQRGNLTKLQQQLNVLSAMQA